MSNSYRCFNGELYNMMLEFIGDPPPCEKCLVREMCFSSEKGSYNYILFELKNPCKEAAKWFEDFEKLDRHIRNNFKKLDFDDALKYDDDYVIIGDLISAEDIIKIIDNWKESNEKLKSKIKLEISSIEEIGRYIHELDPKYCHPRKSHGSVLILNKMISEALDLLKKREIS